MGIVRQIKNVTGGYSSSQVKVRDVTANTESTPARSQMQDIAELTFDNHEVVLIMDMLDKRLNDRGKYWRHVLKALVLLDYLLHYGSEAVVLWCRENLYIVKTLREFHHVDDSGSDVGGAIRARARELTDLVSNQERLDQERGDAGRRRRPRRYRSEHDSPDPAPRLPDRRNDNDEDEELRRALELSKETAAQEEERRRMAGGRSASQEDLTRAMTLSQQNDAALLAGQNSYDPFAAQAFAQQQALAQQQANAEAAALAQAQQEYLTAQQQAQAEQQRLYEMQQAQQAQLAQYQYEQQQQQLAAQQAQQSPPPQEPLQPLKTGSNNPFAAFNQQQQQKQEQSPRPSLGRRQSLHRQSTFDKDHMDRLDQILNLEAPMDTFGNTGMAKVPAQHTQGEFVDSSGRGLTAMLTQRKTGSTNNPFASQGQQYTGIATTQMHPEHTGYGFGNANGNRSSTNLIDL